MKCFFKMPADKFLYFQKGVTSYVNLLEPELNFLYCEENGFILRFNWIYQSLEEKDNINKATRYDLYFDCERSEILELFVRFGEGLSSINDHLPPKACREQLLKPRLQNKGTKIIKCFGKLNFKDPISLIQKGLIYAECERKPYLSQKSLHLGICFTKECDAQKLPDSQEFYLLLGWGVKEHILGVSKGIVKI